MKTEILKDNKFTDGFKIRYPHHVENDDDNPEMVYKTSEATPAWYISQWFSRDSLANGKITNENKIINLEDSTKIVNIKNNKIYIEINGGKEYKKHRTSCEPWPHLLLEQFFSGKKLADCKSLKMILDFEYLKFVNHMEDGSDPTLHTAQFQWFLNFSNQNKNSKGYKDFFWFGLSFLDTPRYDFPPEFMAMDGGKEDATKKFIYIVDSHKYLDKPININDQVNISFEVLDLIKKGFGEAKKRGFLAETEFEDLGFNETNIGFEIPGTFDIGVKINEISLEADLEELGNN